MKAKIKMITAMLIFGSIGIFVKKIDISSGTLALVRGSVGTIFLLTANILSIRNGKQQTEDSSGNTYDSRRAVRKNRLLLIVSGAAIGVNWICLFEAYRYTTIATATLCYYLAPVFVIMISPVFLKERLTLVKVCCVMASLAGMLLVADVFRTGSGGNSPKGILFGVSAAVLYAAVVIMNKHLEEIRAVDMTIAQLGTAAVVLIPYVLIKEESAAVSFGVSTVLLLLLVGIVHTGIAYLLYFSSLAELSGQTAALFSYIDPVTAILLSAFLLHEPMNGAQTAGAVLVLGSTLASELLGGRENGQKSGECGRAAESRQTDETGKSGGGTAHGREVSL